MINFRLLKICKRLKKKINRSIKLLDISISDIDSYIKKYESNPSEVAQQKERRGISGAIAATLLGATTALLAITTVPILIPVLVSLGALGSFVYAVDAHFLIKWETMKVENKTLLLREILKDARTQKLILEDELEQLNEVYEYLERPVVGLDQNTAERRARIGAILTSLEENKEPAQNDELTPTRREELFGELDGLTLELMLEMATEQEEIEDDVPVQAQAAKKKV
jgi:prefoldin subunit 5